MKSKTKKKTTTRDQLHSLKNEEYAETGLVFKKMVNLTSLQTVEYLSDKNMTIVHSLCCQGNILTFQN